MTEVQIDSRRLMLSNLEKVLYPETGFSKADVLSYYQAVSPYLMPHLKGRLLTLKRYPEGTRGEHFYEKRCPSFHPAWLKTVSVPSERRKFIPYCQMNHVADLIWIVNLASIELHCFLSKNDYRYPTMMVFDLDPGPGMDLPDCCRAALRIRSIFDDLKMKIFPKTSGGKGIHLQVPLNMPATFEETKNFSRSIARHLEKQYPREMTSIMRKDLRAGKIFIDWSQNDEHKTTVCVYSLRAGNEPTVSTPLRWSEVETCAKKNNPRLLYFLPQDVLKRIRQYGDLFEPVLQLRQSLGRFSLLLFALGVSQTGF